MTELKQKFVCFDCLDENAKPILHRYEAEPGIIAVQCAAQSKRDMEKFMKRVDEWPS